MITATALLLMAIIGYLFTISVSYDYLREQKVESYTAFWASSFWPIGIPLFWYLRKKDML